ncbi:MAG: UvrD-helicase domain-containing protein [Candidatus Kerfeldbacteria bacterium]|nr:UvrD-helicase domain-containing protein [Candidatus Kerfeldbacteria bacterium]
MTGETPTTVNPEQKKAIEHGDGPLLIVAGAGTGKTTVITQRVAWLILEKKVPTDGILALTFTDKAATEMEERVDRLLPYGYVNLWVSTFHAFAERILRQHAIDIGLPNDFRLLNQTEQWLLIRRHFDRFNLDYYRPLGNPTRFIGALLKHFSRLEDEDITPEAYLAYARSDKLDRGQEQFVSGETGISEAKRLEEVANAYATYRQLLLESSSLDFGTLITYTLELFKKRPAVLEQYRQQFQHVLVDEFQDTNWAQYELIKLLAAPKNNLTVVGDDDQSVYKFRGASISNILEFRKDFPNCRQVVLTTNYRSRQNILDLAYKFIQLNNPNRLEVALRDGKVRVSKQLKSVAAEDGLIEFVHAETQEQEAQGVTVRIIELQKKTGLDWREFAILVRANDQAEQFAHSLELAGVPYQFFASKGLYRKPDVLDLVAYLRLLDNYHESPALFRTLNLPAFALKPDDVVELNAHARRKGISLYQTLVQSRAVPNISASSRKGMDELLSVIRHGATFARAHKVSEVLLDFLKRAGVLAELGKRATPHAVERVATIRKFLDEVAEFEKSHAQPTVRDFLEVFELKLESGDAGSLAGTVEPDAGGVRLMTVHGAKGLEFSYVFIVQLVDRRFPTTERKDPIEVPEALIRETLPAGDVHLQEERRLLYVAMTRAKVGLFLTAAEDYGGQRVKKPSRFLYELGFIQASPPRRPKGLAQLEPQPRQPVDAADVRFVGSKYSFSALRSYEKCPWQFRYAYVLKVPVGGNALLSFGESMHRTLQRFFEVVQERRAAKQADLFGSSPPPTTSQSPVSLDELLQLYDESFVDEWYESEQQRDQFRVRGRESLKRFYEQQAAKLPAVVGLEQDFNLKLDRFTITGKMDRVDLLGLHPAAHQRTVGIVDYKSGRSRDMDSTDRYQLLIYALAAQDPNILNAKVQRLSYYFLDDGVEREVPISDAELEKTKAWITTVAEKIQSGNFAATPGMVCKFCDYRDICEFRDPNY